MKFAVGLILMSGAAVAETQSCLIVAPHCSSVKELLALQPSTATVADLREPLGDLLVANYFPNGTDFVCKEISDLPDLIGKKPYQKVITEFGFSRDITPPLIEYRLEDNQAYCFFDNGYDPLETGNS